MSEKAEQYYIFNVPCYRKLLQDSETRLFLEPNIFWCEAYDKEVNFGKDALYAYINE